MFLQATVDAGNMADAHKIIDAYRPHIDAIDYVEIGAPLITHYGTEIIRQFTASDIPVEKLYADLKMIDFPRMEVTPWIELGIKRISAMAVMNDGAFEQLREMANKHGLTVFVSTMGYPLSHVEERVMELHGLGFDNFICHGAGVTTGDAFKNMCRYAHVLRHTPVNLIGAGGISIDNADALAQHNFKGLIVGRGLLGTEDVSTAVKAIKTLADPPR